MYKITEERKKSNKITYREYESKNPVKVGYKHTLLSKPPIKVTIIKCDKINA